MIAAPIPARQLRAVHIRNSYSRLIVGNYNHRFLVRRVRLHGQAGSHYLVHSVTAWEPGWRKFSNIQEVRGAIYMYSTSRGQICPSST